MPTLAVGILRFVRQTLTCSVMSDAVNRGAKANREVIRRVKVPMETLMTRTATRRCLSFGSRLRGLNAPRRPLGDVEEIGAVRPSPSITRISAATALTRCGPGRRRPARAEDLERPFRIYHFAGGGIAVRRVVAFGTECSPIRSLGLLAAPLARSDHRRRPRTPETCGTRQTLRQRPGRPRHPAVWMPLARNSCQSLWPRSVHVSRRYGIA